MEFPKFKYRIFQLTCLTISPLHCHEPRGVPTRTRAFLLAPPSITSLLGRSSPPIDLPDHSPVVITTRHPSRRKKEKQTNPLSPLRFSPSLSPLNTPLVTTRSLPSSLNQSRADENKFVYSTVTQLPGIPAEGSAGWFTGDEARWRRFNDSGCARPHQTGESS